MNNEAEEHQEISSLKEKINFGKEIYRRAKELFERDRKKEVVEVARYKFNPRDCETLEKELQEFGFEGCLIDSIGKPTLAIYPAILKFIKDKERGDFRFYILSPVLSNIKIGGSPRFEDAGEINSFQVTLTIETIPRRKNIAYQFNELGLVINLLGKIFFTKRRIQSLIKKKGEEINNYGEREETERAMAGEATENEIRLFQAILSKDLQKVETNFWDRNI